MVFGLVALALILVALAHAFLTGPRIHRLPVTPKLAWEVA